MLSEDLQNSRLRAFTRARVSRDHKHYRVQLVGAAILFALALLTVAIVTSAEAGEWQGQEVSAEGVTHVKNPATPMHGSTTVEMEELWRLGGDTDSEEEFFGVIGQVRADADGNLYLLDAQLNEVKIFSRDAEFVRTIGREGEGPGEFRRPADMFIMEDGTVAVLQQAPGRIVLLTADGEPAGEFPLPEVEGGGFRMIRSCNYAKPQMILASGENSFNDGVFQQRMSLSLVTQEGEVNAELATLTADLNMAQPVIHENKWDGFWNRWTVDSDGNVLAVVTFGDYEITRWSPDGKIDRVISREYEKRPRSAEEIDDLRAIYDAFTQQIPNCEQDIESTDSDILTVYSRPDGTIWVLTSWGSRDLPDGTIGTFDVYDGEGRFARQVTLRGEGDPFDDAYFFVQDRVIVVTDFLAAAAAAQGGSVSEDDEEAEPMEVICYRLDDAAVGL